MSTDYKQSLTVSAAAMLDAAANLETHRSKWDNAVTLANSLNVHIDVAKGILDKAIEEAAATCRKLAKEHRDLQQRYEEMEGRAMKDAAWTKIIFARILAQQDDLGLVESAYKVGYGHSDGTQRCLVIPRGNHPGEKHYVRITAHTQMDKSNRGSWRSHIVEDRHVDVRLIGGSKHGYDKTTTYSEERKGGLDMKKLLTTIRNHVEAMRSSEKWQADRDAELKKDAQQKADAVAAAKERLANYGLKEHWQHKHILQLTAYLPEPHEAEVVCLAPDNIGVKLTLPSLTMDQVVNLLDLIRQTVAEAVSDKTK